MELELDPQKPKSFHVLVCNKTLVDEVGDRKFRRMTDDKMHAILLVNPFEGIEDDSLWDSFEVKKYIQLLQVEKVDENKEF